MSGKPGKKGDMRDVISISKLVRKIDCSRLFLMLFISYQRDIAVSISRIGGLLRLFYLHSTCVETITSMAPIVSKEGYHFQMIMVCIHISCSDKFRNDLLNMLSMNLFDLMDYTHSHSFQLIMIPYRLVMLF